MRLNLQQLQQRLLLFGGQVSFVALHQRQQALVPQHGQRTFVRAERQEVRDQSVQHAEGQRVLLIQQQPQENTVGSVVLHLCDFQHGSAATYSGGLAARKITITRIKSQNITSIILQCYDLILTIILTISQV